MINAKQQLSAHVSTDRGGSVTLGLLGLFTAVVIAGTACGGGTTSPPHKDEILSDWGVVYNQGGNPVRGGTIRVDLTDSPPSLSPVAKHFGITSSLQVGAQIFDTLVEYLPGSFDPQPGLAKSWEVSPDGLTYTFHLREAKFSDGAPVTSADVQYTMDLIHQNSFYWTLISTITDVSTPDGSTVVLRLSNRTPSLIYSLALPTMSILPATLIKRIGLTEYNRNPIGSGAFQIARWLPGQQIDLVRNKYYWRTGQPYLDGIQFVAVPNDNTRVLDMQSGTADVAGSIPYAQVKALNSDQHVRVLVPPTTAMTVVWMNERHKPFDETAVRRALCFATPTEAIQKTVFFGLAEIMNTDMPKVKNWNPAVRPYPYDLAKAREELAKSSVPHGFTATISVTGTDEASSQIAQILQQSWAKIGVTLNIRRLDHGTLLTNNAPGDWDLQLFLPGEYTSDIPVLDEFANLQFNDQNLHNLYTWYNNSQAAQLAARATSETDPARGRDFDELQIVTMGDPQSVPLVRAPNPIAVRSPLHDFNYLLENWFALNSVWKA